MQPLNAAAAAELARRKLQPQTGASATTAPAVPAASAISAGINPSVPSVPAIRPQEPTLSAQSGGVIPGVGGSGNSSRPPNSAKRVQQAEGAFGVGSGRYFANPGPGSRWLRRALGAGLGGLQFQALNEIPGMLAQLMSEADPEKLAALRAGETEQASDNFDRVRGEATRRMLASGLTESSYGGAVQGAIDQGEAGYMSEFNRAIGRESQGRADAARALLLSLVNGGNQYNDAALEDRLRRDLAAAQQPGWFDSFAGALGAGASIYKTSQGL